MKKIIVGLCLLASTLGAWAIQEDLSFLTNRTGLVSYALRQVTEIAVSAYAETSPNPYNDNRVWVHHAGDPTVQSFAKTAGAVQFDMSVADTNGYLCVNVELYGKQLEGQPYTPLFTAGVCGKPYFSYDPKTGAGVWKLPVENSQPEIYLYSRVFIKAPGINYAALISTNRWGGFTRRQLQVDYQNEGFWFESDMCGGGSLVTSGWEQDEKGNWNYAEYVFNLRGDGQKRLPTLVEIAILLRDSEDMRDFGINPEWLSAWVYTYTYETQEENEQSITYGKVPLFIAKYNKRMLANLSLGSAVGYATAYKAKNLSTGVEKNIIVPAGKDYVSFIAESGVYHIIPLGINVTTDWWFIQQILESMGGSSGGGSSSAPVVSDP